jgi:hypothetical protein
MREEELSDTSSWVTAPSSLMERMSTVAAEWGSWERASWTAADWGSILADFTEGGTICSSVMGLPSLSRYTPSSGRAAEAVKPRDRRRDKEMRTFFIKAPLRKYDFKLMKYEIYKKISFIYFNKPDREEQPISMAERDTIIS